MYLDIFRLMRWLKICAIGGGVVTALFYGTLAVCLFIFTTPGPRQTWLEKTKDPNYRYHSSFGVPQSVVGLAIDLYILILPILGVMKLQMPNKRKIGIILVFTTASLYEFITNSSSRCILAHNTTGPLWDHYSVFTIE